MAKHARIARDEELLYVMDGNIVLRRDAGRAGEWSSDRLGRGEFWISSDGTEWLADHDGAVIAVLRTDDEWDAFLAGKEG